MQDKILIADDSISFRKMLLHILKNQNYHLLEACDGKEAIDTCFQEFPDLILLDIEMPEYNGYKVCKIIKNNDQTKDISIIFLSARTDASDKIKGLELGAADYITKPFDKGEVLARVRSQLKIRHLTKSLLEANHKLSERQKNLEEDLKAAAQIQKSLIPKTAPQVDNFLFSWQFIPCERIGGDIFNIHRLDESHLAVYIVDVSGHGVPAAMITVSVSQSLLPNSSTVINKNECKPGYEIISPARLLEILDEEYPLERFDKYFTISYLILNTHTGKIRYSSAAHPMPVLVRADGKIKLLKAGGTFIGMGGIIPFEEDEIVMNKGDRLYLYTDGVVEYLDKNDKSYGEKRFYNELVRNRKFHLDKACENVIKSLRTYGGNVKANDDITLLAIERN